LAILEAGALFGIVFTAFFGEQLERREHCISLGVIIKIVRAIFQATAYALAQLLVARIVAGFDLSTYQLWRTCTPNAIRIKGDEGLFTDAYSSSTQSG
jgi:predicted MFS family arabinose efflux permease